MVTTDDEYKVIKTALKAVDDWQAVNLYMAMISGVQHRFGCCRLSASGVIAARRK